jgi:hypothetical protein
MKSTVWNRFDQYYANAGWSFPRDAVSLNFLPRGRRAGCLDFGDTGNMDVRSLSARIEDGRHPVVYAFSTSGGSGGRSGGGPQFSQESKCKVAVYTLEI